MLKISDGRKKIYVVLGRNSSGTSFISKALFDQGVDMGKMILDPPVYEDEEFLRFNEKVLKRAGGDWKNIPSFDKYTHEFYAYADEAKDILRRNIDKDMWGWKDPRNSLLGHLWIRFLKELDSNLDIYLICIFRDPKKVAKSLREDDYGEMMELNKVYNKSIINIIKEFTGV
jgi:hypothetical protein